MTPPVRVVCASLSRFLCSSQDCTRSASKHLHKNDSVDPVVRSPFAVSAPLLGFFPSWQGPRVGGLTGPDSGCVSCFSLRLSAEGMAATPADLRLVPSCRCLRLWGGGESRPRCFCRWPSARFSSGCLVLHLDCGNVHLEDAMQRFVRIAVSVALVWDREDSRSRHWRAAPKQRTRHMSDVGGEGLRLCRPSSSSAERSKLISPSCTQPSHSSPCSPTLSHGRTTFNLVCLDRAKLVELANMFLAVSQLLFEDHSIRNVTGDEDFLRHARFQGSCAHL